MANLNIKWFNFILVRYIEWTEKKKAAVPNVYTFICDDFFTRLPLVAPRTVAHAVVVDKSPVRALRWVNTVFYKKGKR